MSLSDKLEQSSQANVGPADAPVWKGPTDEGVTFSMLSRYLVCKERFRIYTCDGIGQRPAFNHRIHYGSMWHVCEESHARNEPWQDKLADYIGELCTQFPLQQKEVLKWANVCIAQFPVYMDFWARHPDVVVRRPVLQEESFKVRYYLPSKREILLRGKWDSVDMIDDGIWLQENKTKGEIYPEQIQQQLNFDLQTMLYIVALDAEQDNSFWRRANKLWRGIPIQGVRYNVVRRPLSGGLYTIVQHKPSKSNMKGESEEEYYTRLNGLISEDPAHFFMRWKVALTKEDITKFRMACLDPVLENLCDDYEWWSYCKTDPNANLFLHALRNRLFPKHTQRHYIHPYGVWNSLNEGRTTDLDAYMRTRSTVGLARVENYFPELTT